MKVLLANKFYFLKGGAETVYFQERDYLLRKGHDVICFSMKHPGNLFSQHSRYFVPYVEYRQPGKADGFLGRITKINTAINLIHNARAASFLQRLIEKEKPDIAHLHNIYHQITPSIVNVLKKAGIKILLTLHDYKIICPIYTMVKKGAICEECEGRKFYQTTRYRCRDGSFPQSLLLSIEAYWHKWAKSYEGIDLFLAPSRFMAELVTRYRIKKSKVHVLQNGIDPDKIKYSVEDSGYAVYFGRISAEKGIETLLQAHKLLDNQLALKIIGTGPLLNELKEKYRGAEFNGYKSGRELTEIIEKAAFVVIPSEWYENCSMSVLESMAFGKPVIGSRVGGIPEQIENEKTGFLYKMGDVEELTRKMDILSKNRELRKTMGNRARKKLERDYSLERHCNKLIHIYKDLLSEA